MTASWSPVGEGDVRVGLIGLGSMGRNHLRILASMPGARLVAVADPDETALAAATAATGALGFAEPLALLAEADLDAVVIAAPTTTPRRAGPRGHRPRDRGADREAAGRHRARGGRHRGRVARPRRADPGRPRRAVQPSRARARTAPRCGLALERVRHHQPPRRAVPGAHPRCRRHHRPGHPRRRHPVVDRPRAADPRLRRDRPAHPRRPRGPAVRADVVRIGDGRHARRRLADPGEATTAHRRRRGGHVRTRFPHPAPHVHARRPS